MSAPIMLSEFLALERARLNEFERFWHDNAVATPDEFPSVMEPEDWEIQFEAFEQ